MPIAAGAKKPTFSRCRNSGANTTAPRSCASSCKRGTRPRRSALQTPLPGAQPLTALPPVVKITSPAADAHFSGDFVEVAYSLRAPSRLPVDKLDVLADGEPVVSMTGFEKTTGPEVQGQFMATLPKKD